MRIKLLGPGAFYIYPLLGGAGSIQNFLTYSMEPEKEADVTCTNGALTEEYEIALTKTIRVLSIPVDLKIDEDSLAYYATYRLKDNVLTVKREIDDRAKGNVRSPKMYGILCRSHITLNAANSMTECRSGDSLIASDRRKFLIP